jgi:hypothetical protein
MEDDVEMRLKMMQILQLLSRDDSNSIQMINAECASRLVLKINYPEPNEEMLFRTIEILWNLFEKGDQIAVAEQFNSLVAISQIQNVLLHKILHGYSNYDRQLRSDITSSQLHSSRKFIRSIVFCIFFYRNDIMIIVNLIASVNARVPFIETGMARELLIFSTYPESKIDIGSILYSWRIGVASNYQRTILFVQIKFYLRTNTQKNFDLQTRSVWYTVDVSTLYCFVLDLNLSLNIFQVKSNNPIVKNFKLTTCYEDFELKKLFFNFTVIMSRNPVALQVIEILKLISKRKDD